MCLGRVSSGKSFKFSSTILLSKGMGSASNFTLPFLSPCVESSVGPFSRAACAPSVC